MPVRKYRSIADMPDETWRQPGDPTLYRAIRQVWDFGRRTSRRHYPPGVYRYRSIQEMDAAQREWERTMSTQENDSPERS
jgi:hypothetical protein